MKLAENPEFADRFYDDPEQARKESDLTDDQWEVVMSGDIRLIQEAVFGEHPEQEFSIMLRPVRIWPSGPVR